MKNIKKLVMAFSLVVCILVCGCSTPLKLPENINDVSSNGGSVVVVDDYIYFASIYTDVSTLKKGDNKNGETGHNSIYRIKTENDKVIRDEDELIKNIDRVTQKIACYNASNMFVYGSYLYFTSPNAHLDYEGKTMFNTSTLFRVKLNGEELTEIFSTTTSSAKMQVVEGENPYVLVYDDNKISKLEIKDNISKEPSVLVEDVESTVFPSTIGKLSKIFYTTEIAEANQDAGLTGNKLFSLDLSTNESKEIKKNEVEKITLVALENGVLYFKWLKNGEACYYSSTLENGFSDVKKQTLLGEIDGTDSISNFTPINSEYALYTFDSKVYLTQITSAERVSYQEFINESVVIEFIDGEYVYYSTATGIYRKSFMHPSEEKITICEGTSLMQGYVDFEGNYVYYYAQTETNSTGTYYAHRASIATAELGKGQKTEILAEILLEDYPEDDA